MAEVISAMHSDAFERWAWENEAESHRHRSPLPRHGRRALLSLGRQRKSQEVFEGRFRGRPPSPEAPDPPTSGLAT